MEVEDGIAMNNSLSENLFVVIICILNKIPVFVVGKPGSSKTLCLQVIASNLQVCRWAWIVVAVETQRFVSSLFTFYLADDAAVMLNRVNKADEYFGASFRPSTSFSTSAAPCRTARAFSTSLKWQCATNSTRKTSSLCSCWTKVCCVTLGMWQAMLL